jgi:hypothetical protein
VVAKINLESETGEPESKTFLSKMTEFVWDLFWYNAQTILLNWFNLLINISNLNNKFNGNHLGLSHW